MPQQEIAVLDFVFHAHHPRSVLEFGAGGSTVRWSAKPWRWVSIEHDPAWVDRVRDACAACVYKADAETADTYTAPVLGEYNLIFVDGLHRVECVKRSPHWLANGGIVILHDASRLEYREAWDVYPHIVHLTKGDGARGGLAVMWQ